MAHREEFKFAAELADSAMTITYLLLGIVACKAAWVPCSLRPLPWCWTVCPPAPLHLPIPAHVLPTDCKLGDSFNLSLPITSVLPADVWKRLINLALLVRCLVACAWVAGWQCSGLLMFAELPTTLPCWLAASCPPPCRPTHHCGTPGRQQAPSYQGCLSQPRPAPSALCPFTASLHRHAQRQRVH